MAISTLYILIALFLFHSKLIQGSGRQDKLDNFPKNTKKFKQDGVNNSYANINSSSSDSKSANRSIGKRKERTSYEIKYHRYYPLTIDQTDELKALLTEKEGILKLKGDEHKWKDFIILPLPEYEERWNNFCCDLWPVLPGYANVHETLSRCEAKFHPLQIDGSRRNRQSHYEGHLHDFVYGTEGWSFKADFLSCECKYMTHRTAKRGIGQTAKYFFAMKLSKNEYFLLGHVDPTKRKASTIKIIGFRSFKEAKRRT